MSADSREEAELDAPEEARQFLGMRAGWWLDGARWALARWARADETLDRPCICGHGEDDHSNDRAEDFGCLVDESPGHCSGFDPAPVSASPSPVPASLVGAIEFQLTAIKAALPADDPYVKGFEDGLRRGAALAASEPLTPERDLDDPDYHEHVAGDKHSHAFNGSHSHGGVSALRWPPGWPVEPADSGLREARAKIVAEYWRDEVMASPTLRATGMSHPLAMVLAALDGETDPVQMGVAPGSKAGTRLRLLATGSEATPTPEDVT